MAKTRKPAKQLHMQQLQIAVGAARDATVASGLALAAAAEASALRASARGPARGEASRVQSAFISSTERARKAAGVSRSRAFAAARPRVLAFQPASQPGQPTPAPGKEESKEPEPQKEKEEQKGPETLAIIEEPPSKLKPSEWEGVLFAATAPMIAVLFTNPFDVAKTRMQLQGELMRAGEGKKFANVFDCLRKTAEHEGVRGLQKGLRSMLVREAVINSLRLGTFEPILHRIHDHDLGPAPIFKKLIAGGISGALGSFAANPIELIKTRLQSRASSAIAVGNQFEYSGPINAAMSIVRENGVTGLWKGATAGVLRSIVGNATMMTTYSTLKEWCTHGPLKLPNSPSVNVGSSLAAGFVSSLALNPVDVVRTRLYNQKYARDGAGAVYANIPDAVWKIASAEGPAAFLKGFSSNYLFRGPQILISFNIIEAFKHATKDRLRDRAQTKSTLELFTMFDRDGDGRITEDDVVTMLRMAYARCSPAALPVVDGASDEEYVKALQPKVDEILSLAGLKHKPAPRTLDAAAFDRARRPLFALSRRTAEAEAFLLLDADRDGALAVGDIAAAVRAVAPAGGQAVHGAAYEALVAAAAGKMAAHADRDHDGRVSFADFQRLFDDYELPVSATPQLLVSAWMRDAGVPLQ